MENKKKIYRRTELALVAIVLLVCTAILVIMCADSKRQAMEGIRNMFFRMVLYGKWTEKYGDFSCKDHCPGGGEVWFYITMELQQRMQGVLSLQRAHSIIR